MPNVKQCCLPQDYEDDQGAWLADIRAALEQAEAELMQQRPSSKVHQERIDDLRGHASRLPETAAEVPTAVRSLAESVRIQRRNSVSDGRVYVHFFVLLQRRPPRKATGTRYRESLR